MCEKCDVRTAEEVLFDKMMGDDEFGHGLSWALDDVYTYSEPYNLVPGYADYPNRETYADERLHQGRLRVFSYFLDWFDRLSEEDVARVRDLVKREELS